MYGHCCHWRKTSKLCEMQSFQILNHVNPPINQEPVFLFYFSVRDVLTVWENKKTNKKTKTVVNKPMS